MSFDPQFVRTVLCDLDGVIWLAHRPIAGAADAVTSLRAGGRRVLFVTNNSRDTVVEQETALAAAGIVATGDVVTSAMAAARLVAAGERVLVAGGAGVIEAMQGRGAEVIVNDGRDHGTVDAVVVGLHPEFDLPRLTSAATALHRGARLIGTNGDATFPTPTGPTPGGGALLAAVATAGGVEPTIAGKPHRPMAELVAETAGAGAPGAGASLLMVGDRAETDGRFAAELGCPYALVRSGVLGPDESPPPDIDVALDVADLAAVAASLVEAGQEPG